MDASFGATYEKASQPGEILILTFRYLAPITVRTFGPLLEISSRLFNVVDASFAGRDAMRCLFARVVLPLVSLFLLSKSLQASGPSSAQETLNKILLGKDVRCLVEMPAYKDGVDIYYTPP